MDSQRTTLVVVTGGGSGVGAAVTRQLVALGHQVLITGRRAERLEAMVAELGVLSLVADVSRSDDNARVVAAVEASGLALVGLVNNAAFGEGGDLSQVSREAFDRVMATNVAGPVELTQGLLPFLRRQGGSIVMIGSVAGDRSPGPMGAYAVSKAAIIQASHLFAVLAGLGEHPVRCNVVNPGWIKTDMAEESMVALARARGITVDEAYQLATTFVPLQRASTADEVADVVTWLLSDQSRMVNGASIAVDGGHRLGDPGLIPFAYDLRPLVP
jgi:NAD(P)-dependent dehydrogenase (short-subunit alcohol dehydrogenase family)